jgi:hypothetical protein
MTVLGGLCLFLVPPVAFLISLIGLIRGTERAAAVAGLVLSGLSLVLLFGLPLMMSLCR